MSNTSSEITYYLLKEIFNTLRVRTKLKSENASSLMVQIKVVVSIFVAFLLIFTALYVVNGTNGQKTGKKSAIVWMGLEVTNENISADLSSIGAHRSDLTGVSYEHYMLDSTGDLVTLFPITNVTVKIQSFGLNTFPMIISTNLNDIVFLLNHPSR
ncbi:MAG: hypothetical protein QXU98_10500, partial [Candidatus Parvarchaeota archaeon]